MSRSLSLEYSLPQIKAALHIPEDCDIVGVSWEPISQNLTIRLSGKGFPNVQSGNYPLCLRIKSVIRTPKELEELMGRLA